MVPDHAQRYGRQHRALRAQLVAGYIPGQPCSLCGKAMHDHPSRLDLAHAGSSAATLGLAHRACNRDTAALGNRTRAGHRPDPAPTPRTRW